MRTQFETLRLFALMIVAVGGASRGRLARAMLSTSQQSRCFGPDRRGLGKTRSDGQDDLALMVVSTVETPSIDK